MYHDADFEPYLVGQHNQQTFRTVQALRHEKRLRENREARGSRLVAFALRLKSPLHVLRRV